MFYNFQKHKEFCSENSEKSCKLQQMVAEKNNFLNHSQKKVNYIKRLWKNANYETNLCKNAEEKSILSNDHTHTHKKSYVRGSQKQNESHQRIVGKRILSKDHKNQEFHQKIAEKSKISSKDYANK